MKEPQNATQHMSSSDMQYYNRIKKTLKKYSDQHNATVLSHLYQELTMANCQFEFQRDISLSKDTIALHSHTFYEFIFVVRGNVQYLLNNRRYILQKGDLLLIAPGVSHRPLFPDDLTEPYERYVLWLNANFYQSLIKELSNFDYCFRYCSQINEYLIHTPPAMWKPLLEDFKTGFHEKESQAFCSDSAGLIAALSFLMKLNRLCSQLSAPKKTAQNELLDKILLFMDEHISEKITLADAAEHFFVSQSTITHLFRKTLDVSFYQYLIQKRLLLAKERLIEGAPATMLWADCGFSDYSSFYKAFKKASGVSPKEYTELFKH